jgi:hypothetical protein
MQPDIAAILTFSPSVSHDVYLHNVHICAFVMCAPNHDDKLIFASKTVFM